MSHEPDKPLFTDDDSDGTREWRALRSTARHQTVGMLSEIFALLRILLQDAIILVVGFAIEFAFEHWLHSEQPFFKLAINISSAMFLLLYLVMVTVHVVHYIREQFGTTAAHITDKWLPWALGAAGVIVGVVGITRSNSTVASTSLAGTADSLRFLLPPPAGTNFLSNPTSPWPALSPDGRQLALVAVGRAAGDANGTRGERLVPGRLTAGVAGIWIHSFETHSARMLPATEGTTNLTSPFWAPDGRALAFFADGKLKKSDIAGGAPLVLCDVAVSFATLGGTWNQEGVILFSAAGGLYQVPAAGGQPQPVTQVNPERGEVAHSFPYFLPDGRHFLYLVLAKPDVAGIYVGELGGSAKAPQRLVAASHKAEFAAGQLLYMRGRTLLTQPFDTSTQKLSGEPMPLADSVGISTTGGRAAYSVAGNGVMVFGPGGAGQATQLRWFERGGKALNALGSLGPYVDPELSPDGRYVAIERTNLQTNSGDLWLLEAARDVATRFTFDPAGHSYAIWSPDARQIIFRSFRAGVNDLYRKAASGVEKEEVLLTSAANKYPLDWSADGRWLVFAQDAVGGADLWALPLERTGGMLKPGKPVAFLQTGFNEDHAQFSPDGKWLAYTSNESGRYEVYVQSFPQAGGKWQASTGGGIAPRWRGDGRELYYIAPDSKLMAVAMRGESTLEVGIPTTLFQTDISEAGGYVATDKQQYDVSADGQRFLINIPIEGSQSPSLTVIINFPATLKK